MLPTSELEAINEELTTLAVNLRTYLEGYLANPTGQGYYFLRNKIAEYYSISRARTEDAHSREQDRLRSELGVKPHP